MLKFISNSTICGPMSVNVTELSNFRLIWWSLRMLRAKMRYMCALCASVSAHKCGRVRAVKFTDDIWHCVKDVGPMTKKEANADNSTWTASMTELTLESCRNAEFLKMNKQNGCDVATLSKKKNVDRIKFILSLWKNAHFSWTNLFWNVHFQVNSERIHADVKVGNIIFIFIN